MPPVERSHEIIPGGCALLAPLKLLAGAREHVRLHATEKESFMILLMVLLMVLSSANRRSMHACLI